MYQASTGGRPTNRPPNRAAGGWGARQAPAWRPVSSNALLGRAPTRRWRTGQELRGDHEGKARGGWLLRDRGTGIGSGNVQQPSQRRGGGGDGGTGTTRTRLVTTACSTWLS